ncbi:pyridoxal phosphate-dependent aminotransferase [Candidatus Woesearchaeota archaeon]|nr:pyridoxal phosphate-dependent aminotransferase [Candidatus Woesearchaeota archaeon]
MFSARARGIAPSATLAISAKAKAMKAAGEDVIDLSAGEPFFGLFPGIRQAGKRAIDENFAQYTPVPGTDALRQAIAEKFTRENGIAYAPEQVVVSNGAKHTLMNVFLALCDPGDEVIIPSPYWLSYPEQVRLADGKPVIATTEGFAITAESIVPRITERTRAVLLNYPNNPTGSVIPKAELRRIADLCLGESDRAFIIADEVYEHFSYDAPHVSIASLSDEIGERAVTVNAVSKTYAMTGVRIGYCGAPPELAKAMMRLQSHMASNPSSIAQRMAEAAFSVPQAEIRKIASGYKARRDLVVRRLKAMGLGIVPPAGAFYAFPDITATGLASVPFCEGLLGKARVAAVPGKPFGADANIRLSFVVGEEALGDGLDRLGTYVQGLMR